MSPPELEQTIRDLARVARPVRQWQDPELWEFDAAGRPRLLHFFPATGTSPLTRGAATRQFANLKRLLKANVPALRPVALLSGLRFGDRVGDGVLTDAAAGEWLDRLDARRHAKARKLLGDWLTLLRDAGLGHADLSPAAFLLVDDRVVLADAAALTHGGLSRRDLLVLAHRAGETATLGDRLQTWRRLVDHEATTLPRDRAASGRYAAELRRLPAVSARIAAWSGRFQAAAPWPVPWSVASQRPVTPDEWHREWPRLVDAMRDGALETLKSDASGDVLAGRVTLDGRPVDVVLKRPRNKFWYRYVLDAFRRGRAWRTWQKARWLAVRRLPAEYPLLCMERRVGTYAVEGVAVFERVPGVTLEHVDLDRYSPRDRDTLMRRCGRTLRRLENAGLAHTDAKSSNWVVYDPPADAPTRGPVPVMVDAYGVRPLIRGLQLAGVHRLLRAMKDHPQYTPADSLALCQGFAPRATPAAEGPGDAD